MTAFPTAPPDGRPWTPEPPYRRIENRHRGKVLGVDGMSTADSTQVVQSTDNGTEDHEWRFV
ncbi:RICIN domain-containing protein [Streptomyces tunisiensis]|uniref:RICIN domain-containing protein n=1 Tax=Streptomyces tunisiensis TaxID=948699 RepID=UPI003EE35E7C